MYLVPSHLSVEANTRFLTRFHKESAAITKLDHPHILPVYEYGEYVGTPYLVTPYMTQGSLADLLKRCDRYDHTAIVPILEQLASGVAYAHSQGYIHGTLRPSNVVVWDQDTFLVAGFGLMHMLQLGGIEKSEHPYAHLLTVGQTFLASPEYIAPEVVQGQRIDVRSDIYALGCILFELLCGQPPFTGSDPLEIAKQHVNQDIPSLRTFYSEIPIALVSVVNQALERDPARRFQHVEELKEAFIQASRGASATSAQQGRYSGEEQNWSGQAQMSERLQEMSPNGYGMSNTGKWQLLPPIITGKLPALQQPSARRVPSVAGQQLPQSQPAAITFPPIAPAFSPVAAASGSPILAPDTDYTVSAPPQSMRVAAREEQGPPSGKHKAAPAVPASALNSVPGVYEDKNKLAQSYSWWSQDGTVEGDKQGGAEGTKKGGKEGGKPLPYVEAQVPPTRKPLVVSSSDNWISEPVAALDARRDFGPVTKKRRKVSRRGVVAFLVTGGVVAAGTAGVINLNYLQRLLGLTSQSLNAQMNATTLGARQNTQPTQPPNAPTQNKNGTVIGNTKQNANSAVSFANPANDTPGLLVRLANSTFVAYERACTHVGVLVNYDPATKMLVCPAHGAIFDPAKGGAVVQGPAQLPLAKIGIQVQADGMVTTV
jgi:serine/threonine protein kinase/Rieske Fe-S protein